MKNKQIKEIIDIPFETCFYWETYPTDDDIQTIKRVLFANIVSFVFENGLVDEDLVHKPEIETRIVPCPKKEGFNIICKSIIQVWVYRDCDNVKTYKIKESKDE